MSEQVSPAPNQPVNPELHTDPQMFVGEANNNPNAMKSYENGTPYDQVHLDENGTYAGYSVDKKNIRMGFVEPKNIWNAERNPQKMWGMNSEQQKLMKDTWDKQVANGEFAAADNPIAKDRAEKMIEDREKELNKKDDAEKVDSNKVTNESNPAPATEEDKLDELFGEVSRTAPETSKDFTDQDVDDPEAMFKAIFKPEQEAESGSEESEKAAASAELSALISSGRIEQDWAENLSDERLKYIFGVANERLNSIDSAMDSVEEKGGLEATRDRINTVKPVLLLEAEKRGVDLGEKLSKADRKALKNWRKKSYGTEPQATDDSAEEQEQKWTNGIPGEVLPLQPVAGAEADADEAEDSESDANENEDDVRFAPVGKFTTTPEMNDASSYKSLSESTGPNQLKDDTETKEDSKVRKGLKAAGATAVAGALLAGSIFAGTRITEEETPITGNIVAEETAEDELVEADDGAESIEEQPEADETPEFSSENPWAIDPATVEIAPAEPRRANEGNTPTEIAAQNGVEADQQIPATDEALRIYNEKTGNSFERHSDDGMYWTTKEGDKSGRVIDPAEYAEYTQVLDQVLAANNS